jgi:hypothetical protein
MIDKKVIEKRINRLSKLIEETDNPLNKVSWVAERSALSTVYNSVKD